MQAASVASSACRTMSFQWEQLGTEDERRLANLSKYSKSNRRSSSVPTSTVEQFGLFWDTSSNSSPMSRADLTANGPAYSGTTRGSLCASLFKKLFFSRNLACQHTWSLRYTFSTRSFLIRYCEEEVELGDVGQFRIELSPSECPGCYKILRTTSPRPHRKTRRAPHMLRCPIPGWSGGIPFSSRCSECEMQVSHGCAARDTDWLALRRG